MTHLSLGKILSLIGFAAFLSVAPLSPATASDSEIIYDKSGRPIFELEYIDPYDDDDDDDDDDEPGSMWYVTDPEIRKGIALGAQGWIDIIGPYVKNPLPASISVVGLLNRDNDSAGSGTVVLPDGDTGYTSLGAYLTTGFDGRTEDPDNPLGSYHAYFFVGDWPSYGGVSYYDNGPIIALPNNGDKFPTSGVFFHEFGHAMGILANTEKTATGRKFSFSNELNAFTQHLVDARGVSAEAGQRIFQTLADAEAALRAGEIHSMDDAFITDSNNRIYFVGDNLTEVLDGALDNKVVIEGWEWEEDAAGDRYMKPDFSHIELRNSLMSHQYFRNTGVFYEAELAIMEDIGYTLDRRNHYGRSIYNSGQTINNTQGYFARNAAGTAYLVGVHNATDNGIGLHIYGDDNTVTQSADILSTGYGTLGVRVDGWGNDLVIGKNTTIETLGENARGVAITYGSNHTLTHRGTIVATGEGGRGVSFDFGSNLMGGMYESQGSYSRTIGEYRDGADPIRINMPLAGSGSIYENIIDDALVDSFDLSGTINSNGDAIYISDNAHVREINVLNGAAIRGNITSKWDPTNIEGSKHSLQGVDDADYGDYITNLTFGRAQDANGNALDAADDNFRMQYDGDITGAGSLAMTVSGGVFQYNGDASVISMLNESGATLTGNGAFTIADPAASAYEFSGRASYANDFVNDGTLAPGINGVGQMSIQLEDNADFVNNGTIQIGFNQDGGHSTLAINGTGVNNSATFGGVTELSALPGYYASGESMTFSLADLVQVDGDVASTWQNTVAASGFGSTVDFTAGEVQPDGTVMVTASRADDAYSRFGNDEATRTVGREVARISYLADMPESFERVIAGLDLAGSPAGIERGLNQLMPHFANSAATRSLDNQRVMTSALMNRILPSPSASLCDPCGETAAVVNNGPRMFATAIGGGGKQDGKGYSNPGYSYWSAGMLAGIEWENNGVVGGVHVAMNHWNLRGSGGSGDRAKSNAFSLGLHASVAPVNWNGGYLFGLVRGTVEQNRMDRAVNLVTGRSLNHSKWTGFSGSGVLGGGFDFERGSVRFGPVVGLDYALNHRGSLTESGSFGLLDIESETYQSLRVTAGVRVSGRVGGRTTVDVSAQWNHELLGKMGTTRAKFAEVGREVFASRARYPGRDSLGARIGVSHAINDCADIGIEAGGEFFRRGYASAWGSATLTWKF